MESTSFFGRFRNWIRDERHDPGGRYFSMLLKAVWGEQPRAVSQVLFPDKRSEFFESARAEVEAAYNGNRKADLGLYSGDGQLVGLVEVKEDDQLAQGAESQLADYLSYAQEHNVPFAYVTKHTPYEACMTLLTAHGKRPVYYSDLYRALKAETSPICKLFCEYLAEIGPVYMQLHADDSQALCLLVRQVFAVGGAGTSLEGALNSENVRARLVTNVEALGVEFYRQFRNHFGNIFRPQFDYYPNSLPNWVNPINGNGGTLYVWTKRVLKDTRPNCIVWLGHALTLIGDLVTFHHYAGVGQDETYADGSGDLGENYPCQGEAQKWARSIICEQAKRAIQENLNETWTAALQQLRDQILAEQRQDPSSFAAE